MLRIERRGNSIGSQITARQCLLAISVAAIVCIIFTGQAGAAATVGKTPGDSSLVGTQLTYKVQYKSEGFTELRTAIDAAGSAAPPRRNLLGSLEAVEVLTFLNDDGLGVRASVRFEQPVIKIQVDAKPRPDREREIANSLGHPVVIHFDAQSRVARFEFPEGYPPMAANFVKAILALQQYSAPSNLSQGALTWEMQETGANGPYTSHYQVTSTSGTLTRVTKTLARPPSTATGDGPGSATLVQIVPQGKIDLAIDRNDRTVHDLDGVSHDDMLLQGRVFASQNTSVTAHIVSRVRLPEIDLQAAMLALTIMGRSPKALAQQAERLAAARERAIQQQVLGPDSVQSLFDVLSEIDSRSVSRDRKLNVYLKLKALAYVHPEASKALGRRLSAADPSKPSVEMIVTALSTVGSPEAQDALCTAIHAKQNDLHAMTGLVPALGSLQRPTERVIALLQQLSRSPAREVRPLALLALGAAARNLSQRSARRSSVIVNDLAARFVASAQPDEKTTLLLALGNSGSKKAESIVLGQKNSKSLELRKTTITVLGDFQSDAALLALCETLHVDADSGVRSAAAQALGPRSSANVAKDALLRAAQQDPAEDVRLASMFALTNLIPRDVHVRQIISALAQDDSSENVRKQAASLLQTSQPPPR